MPTTPVSRTTIDSEAEAQLFASAGKVVWGRYSKIKGAKPGTVAVTKQGALWLVRGRIDSVALSARSRREAATPEQVKAAFEAATGYDLTIVTASGRNASAANP